MRVGVFMGLIFVAMLVVIGLFFFKANDSSYTYVSGDQSFDVMRVDKTDYKIKIYVARPGLEPEPYYIHTRYGPKQLEDIPVEGDFRNLVYKKQIFVTLNPNEGLTGMSTIAGLEIEKFLDNQYLYSIPTNGAFTESYEGNEEYPIRTCEDVNEEQGIIFLKIGDKTKAYVEENGCVIIQGKTEEEMVMAADRLALYLIGVMS